MPATGAHAEAISPDFNRGVTEDAPNAYSQRENLKHRMDTDLQGGPGVASL